MQVIAVEDIHLGKALVLKLKLYEIRFCAESEGNRWADELQGSA